MTESVSSFSSVLLSSKSPSKSPPLPSKATTLSVDQILPATFSVSFLAPLPTHGRQSYVTNSLLSPKASKHYSPYSSPHKPPLKPTPMYPILHQGLHPGIGVLSSKPFSSSNSLSCTTMSRAAHVPYKTIASSDDLFTFNVHSLFPELDELSLLCSTYHPDVICVDETWLS